MTFVNDHTDREDFSSFGPYVLTMNTRAKASIVLAQGKFALYDGRTPGESLSEGLIKVVPFTAHPIHSDYRPDQLGLAHFVEHMQFEGRGTSRAGGSTSSSARSASASASKRPSTTRSTCFGCPRCSNAPPGISSCAYLDWYRLDLMAVIVVGNVDRNVVATMIRERFSSLINPSPERPGPAFDVPDRPATRYAVVTDKEATARWCG